MNSRGRHQRSEASNPNIRLSKSLSWLLRHGAEKAGLKLDAEGYVDVAVVLAHETFRGTTEAEVEAVVAANDKQRFTIRQNPATGNKQIKANQGHTLQVAELELKPITEADAKNVFQNVIHGTYPQSWQQIQMSGGLSRMRRNHIHFAPGEPGDAAVVSGFRASASVWIYIDMARAIQDGYEFSLSPNNVILTPGNEEGMLPITYFHKVIQTKQGAGEQPSVMWPLTHERGDGTPHDGGIGESADVASTSLPCATAADRKGSKNQRKREARKRREATTVLTEELVEGQTDATSFLETKQSLDPGDSTKEQISNPTKEQSMLTQLLEPHITTGDEENDKRIKKIQKKIREIKKLKDARSRGEKLEQNQEEKITREVDLIDELKGLTRIRSVQFLLE